MNPLKRLSEWYVYKHFDWCLKAARDPEFKKTAIYQERKRATKRNGSIEAVIGFILLFAGVWFHPGLSHPVFTILSALIPALLISSGFQKIIAGITGLPPISPP